MGYEIGGAGMKPVYEVIADQGSALQGNACACACLYFCYCSREGSASSFSDNGNQTYSTGRNLGASGGSWACSCMCFGGGAASGLQRSLVLVADGDLAAEPIEELPTA